MPQKSKKSAGGPAAAAARGGTPARVRLLTLRTGGGEADFGGGLACVVTRAGECSRAAAAIADAVIGPRPQELDGTVEIEGRTVPLSKLPFPLLGPKATRVVDRAALEQVRRDRGDRPRVVQLGDAVPTLISLLDALYDLPSVDAPPAGALALADALDELGARHAATPATRFDLGPIEARVCAARKAAARAYRGVSGDVQARIEARHRDVVESERVLFEATRRDRVAARSAYEDAVAAESDALEAAGIASYSDFLMTVASGVAACDVHARLRAELELADAERELATARASISACGADPGEELLELRARAAQMLGHLPGEDAAAELRALRVDHPDAAPLRAEIEAVLVTVGIVPGSDAVARAIAFVEDYERGAAHTGGAAHVEHRFVELEAEELAGVLDACFDTYRQGTLLAGALPVVIDGVFDDIETVAPSIVAARVAAVHDVQVVVVTADGAVAAAFASQGARMVSWPILPVALVPEPEPEPAAEQAEPGGVACAQCARPTALDDLVFVPGETDLWCSVCVEAATPPARVLRRRGA